MLDSDENTTTDAGNAADAGPAAESAAPPAPRKRTRTAKKAAPAVDDASSEAVAPVKAPRKRAAKASAPDAATASGGTAADGPASDGPADTAVVKPARKRAAKKVAPTPVDAPTTDLFSSAGTAASEAPEATLAAPRKATRRRATSAPLAPAFGVGTPEVAAPSAVDPVITPSVATPPTGTVLFQAPAEVAPEAAPTRRRRSSSRTQSEPFVETSTGPAEQPADTAEEHADASAEDSPSGAGDADSDTARKRRRRGRRGRGSKTDLETTSEGEAGNEDGDNSEADAEPVSAESPAADEDADGGDGTSRRRRRRRRSGSDSTSEESSETPAPAARSRRRSGSSGSSSSSDDGEVKGIRGSSRLEAKRQRRRDGRDTSRRRPPILTEAEFLARRESVDRVMAVRQRGDRTQIAILEDDILVEHYVTRASAVSYVGNVYLGRVQNVLPSMEAAFVDISKGRNGVLYAGEVNWDAAGLEGKARAIEAAMKPGDALLVQVTKDPIGHKGARLTSQISLPGRYIVYVPGGGMTGISRRLPDTERHRLKAILKTVVPDEAGVIVRTAAEGATEEDLVADVHRLQAQWEQIQAKAAEPNKAPVLVHGEPDLAIRVVRDVFNEDFQSMVVEGEDAWTQISDYVSGVAPELGERVSRYTGTGDLFHDLRVDEQLAKALDRKVWLPSGGSLVIDRTEAMVVIDVNTGKFTGSGGNLEATVTKNNLEAAEEIVRQLRLRDVGGIIVIDFIDMVLESNRDLVLRRLTECLGRDRTKHQVAEVTSLGLVQMTRKRVGEGLLEAFSEPCEVCHGRGVIIHSDPIERGQDSTDAAPRSENGGARRGRRGRSGAAEVVVAPAETAEQRRAAAAAMAAIARTVHADDDHASGSDADLIDADTENASVEALAEELLDVAVSPSDLPDADPIDADPIDADPIDAEWTSGEWSATDAADNTDSTDTGYDQPVEPYDSPSGEVGADSSVEGPVESPVEDAVEVVAIRPRRRRAASRPAGPPAPVGTPG